MDDDLKAVWARLVGLSRGDPKGRFTISSATILALDKAMQEQAQQVEMKSIAKFNERERICVSQIPWDYSPPPKGMKVFLLNAGKVATIGPYTEGTGIIAWNPLFRRDKEIERSLGL